MESSTLSKRERYDAVDLFKLIGSFLVIAIHTQIFSSFSETLNHYFINIFARMAVYFFFVAASFFFFKSLEFENGKIKKSKENFDRFKKYFFRLCLLYGIWSLIYMIWDIPIWQKQGCLDFKNIVGFLIACVLNQSHYHMWFLLSLVYAVPILYFLLRHIKVNTVIAIFIALYAVGLLYGSYALFSMPLSSLWEFVGDKWPRIRTVIFNVIPICVFAMKCRSEKLTKAKINIAAAVFFLLFSAEGLLLYKFTPQTASSYSIFTIPATVFIFMLALNWDIRIKHSYVIRKLSTIIYCMHPLVMGIVSLFTDTATMNSLLYFTVVSVLTVAVGIAIVLCGKNIPQLKFLKYIM